MAKKKEKVFKIYNIDQAAEEVQTLSNEKANFETIETASTIKIRVFRDDGSSYVYWYLENTKQLYFLILLNKLKKEIEANEDTVNRSTFSEKISDVKYFAFNKDINEMQDDSGSIYALKDVWEADISHAYYRAAYVLGFISKGLYLEIVKNMTKHDRLRLLGCIASVKTTTKYFEGVPEEKPLIICSEILRSAWFKICHYIDSALIELKGVLGKDFLFYWVDGIYFRYTESGSDFKTSEHWHNIRRIFFKFNVDFKCIPIPLFTVINNNDYLEINIIKPDGKVKRFFPEKRQIKTYKIIEFNPQLKNEN